MKFKFSMSLFTVLLLTISEPGAFAQTTSLTVPYYVQGMDSAWADVVLGNNSSVTIRTHGCALTCISMVSSFFYNKDLSPAKINNWLKENNGFEDGWNGSKYIGKVNINWSALAGFEDGMVYTRFDWNVQPADLLLIRYYLEKGIPVIAEVEYHAAPHYIVLTGWNEKDGFTMNDPELPDQHILKDVYNVTDRWGTGASRNVYGIRILYPPPNP